MKIEINKPCHENWDAMTPTAKGAFCAVCTKDVVDFSAKTMDEIKSFFSKPQEGKVCGRFKETQLQELSFDSFFSRFSLYNLRRKVATVVAFSFFAWFFGAGTLVAQDDKHKKGKIKVTNTGNNNNKPLNPKDTTKCVKDKIEPIMMKGEVIAEPSPKRK